MKNFYPKFGKLFSHIKYLSTVDFPNTGFLYTLVLPFFLLGQKYLLLFNGVMGSRHFCESLKLPLKMLKDYQP